MSHQHETFRKESTLDEYGGGDGRDSSAADDSDDGVDSDQELMDIVKLLEARTKRALKRKRQYQNHIEQLESRLSLLERQCEEMRSMVGGPSKVSAEPTRGTTTVRSISIPLPVPAPIQEVGSAQTSDRNHTTNLSLGHHFPGQPKRPSVHAVDIEVPELSNMKVDVLHRRLDALPDLDTMKTRAVEIMKGNHTPESVTINSLLLQTLLNKVLGLGTRAQHFSSADGMIFNRPFKTLLQYEDDILKLPMEFLHTIPRFQADEITGHDRSIVSVMTHRMPELTPGAWRAYLMAEKLYCCSECTENLQRECPTTDIAARLLKTLETLINDFIKRPLRDLRDRSRKSIRFENLWYLFQPGDLIVTRPQKQDDYARAFRIINSYGGQEVPTESTVTSTFDFVSIVSDHDDRSRLMSTLFVEAYFYDFDGSYLIPILRQFAITPFDEDMDIVDLEIFPVEYAEPETRAQLTKRGKRFTQLCYSIEGTYLEYKDWELDLNDDFKTGMMVSSGRQIEEKVIVDSRTFLKLHPHLKPSNNHVQKMSLGGISQTNFQQVTLEKVRRQLEALGKHAKADDYMLCHYRLHAFIMRKRTWIQVHVKHLFVIKLSPGSSGLENLILPHGHKRLLSSLIDNYSGRKTTPLPLTVTELAKDLPSARNFLILLYGGTGTGKSYTAVTVARKLNKPLYALTCDSLGTTSESIEASLTKHFEIARQWGSVVLLKHAEVLFTIKATHGNLPIALHGNLSPLFLELLTFYPGLLFVSMSVVFRVDEAIRSTAPISLYYPPFDLNTSLQVWEAFVDQLQATDRPWKMNWDYFKEDITDFAKYLWNVNNIFLDGRQIRNLFQAALSLANQEDRDKTTLRIKHLEVCFEAMNITKKRKTSIPE